MTQIDIVSVADWFGDYCTFDVICIFMRMTLLKCELLVQIMIRKLGMCHGCCSRVGAVFGWIGVVFGKVEILCELFTMFLNVVGMSSD